MMTYHRLSYLSTRSQVSSRSEMASSAQFVLQRSEAAQETVRELIPGIVSPADLGPFSSPVYREDSQGMPFDARMRPFLLSPS